MNSGKLQSRKIRDSARDQSCTMQRPECNGDPATVVLCHSNLPEHAGGMGAKASDLHSFDGCSACHDWFDGRLDNELPPESERREWFGYANARTLARLVQEGLIKCP